MAITQAIADIQAQHILNRINSLDCEKEVKEQILDELIYEIRLTFSKDQDGAV